MEREAALLLFMLLNKKTATTGRGQSDDLAFFLFWKEKQPYLYSCFLKKQRERRYANWVSSSRRPPLPRNRNQSRLLS
jgi:hypothetical protein